ncbi:MAG: quinolinate phosphoribosyl transferase [Candidatus Auribacterota bacterium]|nr:quinolinate phosphoribosyl transferase [Candidatus Auribacterota bacterium]
MPDKIKRRISPEVFGLPGEEIKRGFYSDKYFVRAGEILKKDGNSARVLMQIFARKPGIICGMDEAIAVLKLGAEDPDDLVINGLFDGDSFQPMETVMTIEGEYSNFAHLETVYLGVIARGTAVATAVRKVVEAAEGRPISFFPARFDGYRTQKRDGYAAHIAGADGVSTDAQGLWWGGSGLGTVPHGLIAAYGGDTVQATLAFDRYMPEDVKRIALVDFTNDCVGTSLAVARALPDRLFAVRLDTAADLKDISVKDESPESRGVCPELVRNVRRALDQNGFNRVRIAVSGGFTADRIRRFIKEDVPFDMVGVGSSLLKERIDFTADVVMVNGKPGAKVGRSYRPNPRLA